MTPMTLDELCKTPPQRPRKEYTNYRNTITTTDDHAVLEVNLSYVAEALRGDEVWATTTMDRSALTFKPIKYERALATVRAGEPIFMPWLTFKRGRTCVMDGRHRLYALIDEGYTHVMVVTDPWNAAVIRTLADGKGTLKPSDEMTL